MLTTETYVKHAPSHPPRRFELDRDSSCVGGLPSAPRRADRRAEGAAACQIRAVAALVRRPKGRHLDADQELSQQPRLSITLQQSPAAAPQAGPEACQLVGAFAPCGLPGSGSNAVERGTNLGLPLDVEALHHTGLELYSPPWQALTIGGRFRLAWKSNLWVVEPARAA